MTNPTIPQTVRFPDLFDKPLVATFDREQASSDGGAVLLKAAERVYGLVKAFARCLVSRLQNSRGIGVGAVLSSLGEHDCPGSPTGYLVGRTGGTPEVEVGCFDVFPTARWDTRG